MSVIISDINEGPIESADGGIVGVCGPRMGCLSCKQEVSTRWASSQPDVWHIECDLCSIVIATEWTDPRCVIKTGTITIPKINAHSITVGRPVPYPWDFLKGQS